MPFHEVSNRAPKEHLNRVQLHLNQSIEGLRTSREQPHAWHFQVMRVLVILYPDYWGKPSTSFVALIITISATLILASLSFYLIEKPLMGWGKKRLAAPQKDQTSGRE